VFGRTATAPFVPSTVCRAALAAWGWKDTPNPKPDGPPTVWARSATTLKPITPHECRPTVASLAIAASVDAKAISTCCGHSPFDVTYRALLDDAANPGREARGGVPGRPAGSAGHAEGGRVAVGGVG
jgi:hypothetical protein